MPPATLVSVGVTCVSMQRLTLCPGGFALKHYTEDGVWDMVGNNTPVFFIRDPTKVQRNGKR